MADQEHDEMMARYSAARENQSRERLSQASDLIAKFAALSASKGVVLDAEAFEYIPTTGVVAIAPGIARALLGSIKTERDGLLSFNDIASRFPPSTHCAGCFAGPDFILMAHPYYRRGMHPINNWAPRFIDDPLTWRFQQLEDPILFAEWIPGREMKRRKLMREAAAERRKLGAKAK